MGDAIAPMQGAIVSPIRGGDGNVEFLLWLEKGAVAADVDLDRLVAGTANRH